MKKNNNKTCEFKYRIGRTVYCEIRHNGFTPCTDKPSTCKDAKLLDSRYIPVMYYSFKEKEMETKNIN